MTASPYSGKNVLILGGLGMMGSTLAHKLVEQDARVMLADAQLASYGANLFNIRGIEKNVEVVTCDVRDKRALELVILGHEYVFNLAGQVNHNKSLEDPWLDMEINYLGHVNVLETCRKLAPEARVMYAGSRLQFGETRWIPVDEKHPQQPKSPYGLHKLAAEHYAIYMAREHGLRTVVFRIANPYGPRSQMRHHGYNIINWFIGRAMDGKDIAVFGDGGQMRDYVYIDDLADAILAATALSDGRGECFNIGSGRGTRFIDMAKTIVEIVGSGRVVPNVSWPPTFKNIETGDYVSDIDKIKSATGWQPKVLLEEGIRKTFEYYSKYREHYR